MSFFDSLEHLSEAVPNRAKLRFRGGKFRVLTFSELHGVVDCDRRLTRDIGAILDEVDTASRRLRSNVAADAVFEVLFLKIRAEYRRRT